MVASRPSPWGTLAVVAMAWFLILLDDTATVITLPAVGRELGLGMVGLEWVVNAYTLTFAVFTLWGGMGVDRYGPRPVFIVGWAVFAAASALAGFSTSGPVLITARAVQGVGAALAGPAALALLLAAFADRARAVALGVWSAVAAAALASGPLVGALLTATYGWRSIFLVNVPIAAAILLVLGRGTAPANAQPGIRRGDRVDIGGMLTSAVALSALVFGLTQAGASGWRSAPVLFTLGIGAAGLVALVVVEHRATAPLLPLSLFRLPNVLTANMLGMVSLAVMCSLFFFLSLFLQAGGSSPIQAGLALLPLTAIAAVTAPLAGLLVEHVGPRWPLAAGMTLTTLGLVVLSGITPQWGGAQLLPGLLMAGAGIGLATTPITSAAMDHVPPHHYGAAAATFNTFRTVGLSVGVAVMGSIVAAQWPRTATPAQVAPTALASGLTSGFMINAGLSLAAAVLAIATIRTVRLRDTAVGTAISEAGQSADAEV
jgi:EmrB/QacA subfamily drug resistance transporter